MRRKKPKGRPFLRRLRGLLSVRETPRVVAASFASATLCGTSPFFVGIPLLPLLIRFLRLNKVVAVAVFVLLIANPFMMLLVVAQTWLGLLVMGRETSFNVLWCEVVNMFSVMRRMAASLGSGDFSGFEALWRSVAKLLGAYAVGGYGSAVLFSLAVFFVLWPVLERRRACARERSER